MSWTETVTAIATAVAAIGAMVSAILLIYQLHLTKKPLFNSKLKTLYGGPGLTNSTLYITNVSQNQAKNVVVEFALYEVENRSQQSLGKELIRKKHQIRYLNPEETINLYFPIPELVQKFDARFERRTIKNENENYERTAPKETILCKTKVNVVSQFGFLPVLNKESIDDDFFIEWVGWNSTEIPQPNVWHERDGHFIGDSSF